MVFVPLKRLDDGSFLSELYENYHDKQKRKNGIRVRVIEYAIDEPERSGYGKPQRLITSLLDPDTASSKELAVEYHRRWEIELMIDEVDTHQRVHSRRPLRSEKPDGVIQEMYGLLLAHYLVRFFMYEASKEKGISPVRLSFINSLRIIRRYVDKFQIVNRNKVEVLYCRMLSEISREYLPVRDHRINPRAVRRKVIKFALKRKRESHASRLCKPFAKSIVMLN
jgi:hypothetical protein